MISIRAARAGELDAIVELDRRCFVRPWSSASWAAELGSGSVFVSAPTLVGLACASVVLDRCELRRIAVDPLARRAGLGRDLLAHVIEHAHRRGCAGIELEVGARNEAAIALYRAEGFEIVGTRVGYYSSPPDDALLMDLALRECPSQNID